MMQPFEDKGIWWLPDKPDKDVTGIIKYSPERGVILELFDTFRERVTQENLKLFYYPIVIGYTFSGKYITLLDCQEIRYDIQTSSFRAEFCLVRPQDHFKEKNQIKFKKINLHFSDLDYWINMLVLNIDNLVKTGESNPKEKIIKYEIKDPLNFDLGEFKVVIKCNPDIEFKFTKASIKIEELNIVSIDPGEEKDLDWYLNKITHLSDFLSLLIDLPVSPDKISGEIQGEHPYNIVDIYYQPLPSSKLNRLSSLFLFNFDEIYQYFETLLKNWFKNNNLRHIAHTYSLVIRNPDEYLENKFLNLIHAIESYHRAFINVYELPEEEHSKRISRILNSVDNPEDKKWLDEKLKFSNELSLRKRFRELYQKFESVLREFFDNKLYDEFVNKVIKTRNYYIHYNPNSKENILTGDSLLWAFITLKLITEICLLNELGLPLDLIQKGIGKKPEYKSLNPTLKKLFKNKTSQPI